MTGSVQMGGCVALVVSAGIGQRVGGSTPKQYLSVAGQPILRRSLLPFLAHPRIDAVRVVIHPDARPLYDAATAGLALLDPVHGGETRQNSVRFGLESLAAQAPDRVLIHDAARPFVDDALIDRVLDALDASPGAIPAVAVADTLKRGAAGRIETTVPREGLWRAQTPQGFRYADVLALHHRFAGTAYTDDAALLEAGGLAVALVDGSEDNFKITTADDLRRAAVILGGGETRMGTGFDVHAFHAGDHVMLGGVKVPHDKGLEGHSDADVALHALTDALLGAIAEGDIGVHFPPTDPRWKGASSDRFLRHAAYLAQAKGAVIVNVDLTVICERPKIGPHRPAMVKRIAEILSIDPGRVSVKGTTTERLGFLGRGEGIGAQAVATIRLPTL
jgi:2-C-methyl-D-erythritol 4-phosphate cytidylyltransferase/2-C-methyl-D-erythritol 2,4-cyclodiphosphate synthase